MSISVWLVCLYAVHFYSDNIDVLMTGYCIAIPSIALLCRVDLRESERMVALGMIPPEHLYGDAKWGEQS